MQKILNKKTKQTSENRSEFVVLDSFFDFSSFTDSVTDVVEFSTSYFTMAGYFNFSY